MYEDLMSECENQDKFRRIQVSALTLSVFDIFEAIFSSTKLSF